MRCYRDGGCGGIYEMYSCSECPASKPEYLNHKPAETSPEEPEIITGVNKVLVDITTNKGVNRTIIFNVDSPELARLSLAPSLDDLIEQVHIKNTATLSFQYKTMEVGGKAYFNT